jgi:hypothetical protein
MMFVACGVGTNTIAYSYNGIIWTGVGATILATTGLGLAWNGLMWVAGGNGGNSLAYSYDGITWTGLGNISPAIYTVAWNGSIWVAGGDSVSNSLLYSYDGLTWTGVGTSIFSQGRAISWNGNMFIAGGGGTNTLAYSYNGINWTGLGIVGIPTITLGCGFNSARPHRITFPTPMLVATGSGTNTLAYSPNGIAWTGMGTNIFSTQGNGVASNSDMWVATGSGTNTLAYSTTDIETPYIYLPFENGLFKDVMGNSNVALTGSVSYVPGVRGSTAVNLSNPGATGINYLLGSWAGSSSFTVSFWFNMQSFANGQAVIFSAHQNTLLIIVYAGSLSIYSNSAVRISSTAQPSTNTWYYATYIHQNNGLCSLYLNNSLVGSYTNSGGLGTSSGNFCLGTYDVSQGTPFNGYIDDFRLYNYATTVNPRITWRGLGTGVFSTQGKNVAWNGSMWVAVGSGTNSIAYSYDGITWMGLGTYVLTQGNGVAWSGSMWIAVGSGTNSIAYSYDGLRWTGLGTSVLTQGNGVAWNGTLWVTVGSGTNSIAYSYDGMSWTGLGVTLFSSSGNSVAWNNRWVAVGSGTNTILYSSNGISWVSATSCFTTAGNGVTWNGTRWLAVGSGTNTIGYSSNGSTWTGAGSSIISTAGSNIASNTGLPGTVTIQHPIIAVGSGLNSLAYSLDGVRWTGLGTTIFTAANSVAWNGSKWIACGTGSNTLAYSYDGLRWTALGATIFTAQAYGVAWSGSLWVAVGTGINSIVYSTDGLGWGASATGNAIFTSCNAIAWSGSQWVAVGAGTNSLAYSADGKVWTAVSATIFSTQGNGVCWTGSLWVAVGSGTNSIAYSYDGVTWTGLGTTIFSTSGNGVCWNGTRWVAVGTGTNTLAYSMNGTSWIGLGANLLTTSGNGVCWTGTRFVAVGSGSISIIYSTDGLTWNIVSTVTPTIYLPFDGSSVDMMGNTVTVTGTPSYVTGSIGPQAINLANTTISGTATQYVRVPISLSIKPGFTISCLFNLSVTPTGQTVIWEVGTSTVNSVTLCVSVSSIYIQYQLTGGWSNTTIATSLSINTWYNITVIYAYGGTSYVYVNGALAATFTITTELSVAPNLLSIGTYTASTAGAFKGYIDDFKFYSMAITWSSDLSATVFTQGNGVAGNPRLGGVVCDSQISLIDSLDMVSDVYYNTGYTEMSTTVQSQTLVVDASTVVAVVKSAPGAPTAVSGSLYPSGAASGIRVTFSYPTFTGGGIDAFYASAIDIASVQPTVTVSGAAPPITINGLVPGTTYRIQAYASNSAGQSVAVVAASNVLFQVPPSAPQNYVVSLDPPANPTGIVVSFTAPAISGGVTSYTVTAYQGVTPFGSAQTGTALSYTFTGFTAGTMYNFSAVGTNTGGTGSVINSSITYYTKPDAPSVTGVTLDTTGGQTGVGVAFTSGATGGGTLTYVATAYIGGVATALTASGSSSPLKITGLTPGTSYTYKVVASNASVSSDASTAFGPTLYQLAQPDAPSIQSVAIDSLSTPTGINVTFTTNGYNGGGTLSYVATAYSGVTAISSSAPSSTSPIKVTGLTTGTPYTFKVVASNVSASNTSAASSSLTYYTKSGPPTGIGAALNSSTAPTGVNVSFTAPSSLAGGNLTYVATAYSGATAISSSTSSATSPLFINGLSGGTPYTFSVVASHGGVSSDTSATASLTYYTKPSAPTGLSASNTNAVVTISFTGSSTTGGGTLAYIAVAYSGSTEVGRSGAGNSPLSVTSGMAAGSTYTFKVYAYNTLTTTIVSDLSTGINATFMTVPGAPTSLSATKYVNPSNGWVYSRITWGPPSSNGGSPITGYSIYITDLSGSEGPDEYATVDSNTYSYISNIWYGDFYISAINGVGNSSNANLLVNI